MVVCLLIDPFVCIEKREREGKPVRCIRVTCKVAEGAHPPKGVKYTYYEAW